MVALADEFIDALDAQRSELVVDAIIVLRNHDPEQTRQRLNHAYDLMLQRRADFMLMSMDSNTHMEAVRFRLLALDQQWGSITIVTHQYHHYRAFLTFLKAFRGTGVRIISKPIKMNEMYLYEEMRKIEEYDDCASFKEGLEYLNDHRNTT